ncbi:MAG: hypothetical protein V2A34_05140, partial [Lentisphaerota bacterium]
YQWSWLTPTHVIQRLDAANPYQGLVAQYFPLPGENPARLADLLAKNPESNALAQEFLQRIHAAPPSLSSAGAGEILPAPAHGVKPVAESNDWEQLKNVFRLLFNPPLRNQWLLDQVRQGKEKGMLSLEEEQRIRLQIPDPYIQLYLKCLVVHLCLLPLTNLVVIVGGALYALTHHLPFSEGVKVILLGLAFFAVFPMSPGSLARGLYVLWVVWRQKQWRRLRIALALSFWRYVGYLAFPIQMVSTFPSLSRFMAARWATETVHFIPAIGRPGGLLEHRVFDLFFNLPISIGAWWRARDKHSPENPS